MPRSSYWATWIQGRARDTHPGRVWAYWVLYWPGLQSVHQHNYAGKCSLCTEVYIYIGLQSGHQHKHEFHSRSGEFSKAIRLQRFRKYMLWKSELKFALCHSLNVEKTYSRPSAHIYFNKLVTVNAKRLNRCVSTLRDQEDKLHAPRIVGERSIAVLSSIRRLRMRTGL